MRILGIDAGNTYTGYALVDFAEHGIRLIDFGKVPNEELNNNLPDLVNASDVVAVEMVASYGMAVGKEVFDTCVWIGRFIEQIIGAGKNPKIVYRKDEKMAICGSMRAKDSNIRQALIDRYARFDFKNGKGKKNNPDTFYGVSADVWAAIAVAVTQYEKESE